MDEKQPIKVEVNQKIAVIQFIRQEAKNPLSVRILEILENEFDKLVNQTKVKTIIFTGSDDIFAAGAN